MYKIKTVSIAIAASIFSMSTFAGVQSFDSRSHGMGGVGVASSDYLTSAFHNPALGARYTESDDIGILIPSVGVQVFDEGDTVSKIEDFSDVYDTFENNPTIENAESLISSLEDMQGSKAYVQAGAGVAIAIPTEYVSLNFYGKTYVDAYVLADISDDDLDASSIIANTDLTSQGVTMGVSIIEGGIAVSKSFEVSYGTWYLGMTPKYQQVKTINYIVDIENYETDDWDDEKYQSEDTAFNLDMGVAYEMPEGFVFGLSGRNLIDKSYETATTRGVDGVYNINPVFTLGASFNHSLFTIAADVDLNESERYSSLDGLNSDIDADSDNTQMVGIGAEFNAWDWAQLRVGYQSDIADTLEDQFTAGIGLSPFGAIHIDVSASYAGDNQFGGVVQTYMTF